ncbi:unnamed protein product [Phyllotreta striolata]|uniref:Leucine-rich melanocyte differentiation-associated protein-like n=1 Tax=Phyllotreta striolata TaxID=444603 RepID=A0A9N9TJL0_PHYSR|nr:unnamed protein product [Phyllotreta striolata]
MEEDIVMLPSVVTFIDNRLCYNGQNCQKIPPSLAKLYGSKTEALDLSYNELVNIRGVEGFPNIRELILDNNELDDNIHLPDLPRLHTLSLNKNKIRDLPLLLSKISKNLPNVTYLSLLGNQACPDELTTIENDEKDYQRYRYYVLSRLPNLRFLDSKKVSGREMAEAAHRGKYMKIIKPAAATVQSACFDDFLSTLADYFTPLPKTLRNVHDYKGSYGKCQYRYSGKHSEGNRFISNKDL